jgi:hypothetical protein
MIISEHPYPFILFSMNKTGTSSMDYALRPYFDQREKLSRLDDKQRDVSSEFCWNNDPYLKHAPPKWLAKNSHVLNSKNMEDYFKAAFVRHPADRLLSVYSFHIQKIPQRYPEAVQAGNFTNWLRMGGTGSARHSMKEFFTDDSGRMLVDFCGKYENLDEDWILFTQRAGLPAIQLPTYKATKTVHRKYTEVYSPEDIEILLQNPIWKSDLEFFGYQEFLANQ